MQLANLSQIECEIFFLHWVVTERNLSPYLSPVERLTCPVLWCGINFDNEESLLCHLKDCPHLATSGYWCPRCHRAESFASHKTPVPRQSDQIPVQKRPSRLKRLLHKHFVRKRASDPCQDPTMKLNLPPPELYSFPSDPICEMDGQDIHGNYGHSGLSSELGAPVEKWGQLINTWDCPDTLITNSQPYNIDDWIHGVEKDGDMIFELPTYGDQITCNTSLPESSQVNVPRGQSGPVRALIPPVPDAGLQQFEALWSSNFEHNGQATFPKSARQSRIDGRNPAPGMIDHQDRPTYTGYDPSHTPNRAEVQRSWNPGNLDHAPKSTPSGYPFPHTQNLAHSAIEPTLNTTNFLADAQKVRHGLRNPETGPVNPPLAAGYNQTNTTCSNESMGTVLTPVTAFSGAGSSTSLPTHSSYGPSPTPNWTQVQNYWRPQVSPNHAASSTPSAYVLLYTQNLAHINIKPTINTINVPAGGQRVRHSHPNPETGPGNSPLSASTNQTNTTYSNESMVTVPTQATSFSDSDSPTALSPRYVSNSAQSSGNPRQNRFTCKKCGDTLTDASNLRRHEKYKHGKVDRIPCRAGCGRKFTRRDNEERHYINQSKMERSGSDTKRLKSIRFGVLHVAFASNNNPESRGTGSSTFRAPGEPSRSLC